MHRAHGTVAAAIAQRLNRLPRRLALAQIEIAGVRPRPAGVAEGLVGVALAPRAPGVVDVASGSAFLTSAGAAGVVLETQHGCTGVPGTVAAVAVVSDGLTVFDDAADLGGAPPFGRRRRPPAELWWGVASTVPPAGLLTFALMLTPPPGRATASASITVTADPPPALRWEALTSAGPEELAVERDDTRGLTRDGVIVLRAQSTRELDPLDAAWPRRRQASLLAARTAHFRGVPGRAPDSEASPSTESRSKRCEPCAAKSLNRSNAVHRGGPDIGCHKCR